MNLSNREIFLVCFILVVCAIYGIFTTSLNRDKGDNAKYGPVRVVCSSGDGNYIDEVTESGVRFGRDHVKFRRMDGQEILIYGGECLVVREGEKNE